MTRSAFQPEAMTPDLSAQLTAAGYILPETWPRGARVVAEMTAAAGWKVHQPGTLTEQKDPGYLAPDGDFYVKSHGQQRVDLIALSKRTGPVRLRRNTKARPTWGEAVEKQEAPAHLKRFLFVKGGQRLRAGDVPEPEAAPIVPPNSAVGRAGQAIMDRVLATHRAAEIARLIGTAGGRAQPPHRPTRARDFAQARRASAAAWPRSRTALQSFPQALRAPPRPDPTARHLSHPACWTRPSPRGTARASSWPMPKPPSWCGASPPGAPFSPVACGRCRRPTAPRIPSRTATRTPPCSPGSPSAWARMPRFLPSPIGVSPGAPSPGHDL